MRIWVRFRAAVVLLVLIWVLGVAMAGVVGLAFLALVTTVRRALGS